MELLTPPEGPYTQLDDLLQLRFVAKDLNLQPRGLARASQAGAVRTRFRGRGMEFEEVRHYQAGDDIRSIDWRVTARTQIPHTKLYREERERPVLVVTDQRASMYFGSRHCFKSVTACHTAALLSWAALHHNDRIGGLVFGDHHERDFRPKRSRSTLLSLLRCLTDFNHQLSTPLAEQPISLTQRLIDLRRIARPGSSIFLISDFHDFDSSCSEQLFQLARHCDLTLLHIKDALEQTLPPAQWLSISNGKKRSQINTQDKDLRNRFSQHYQQRLNNLQTLANQLRAPLLTLGTDANPLTKLQQLYGRRA